MKGWRPRFHQAQGERAWRRWVRDWRMAVAWSQGEATVLPWRLRRLGHQVFHRLQQRATALVGRGWTAPAPRPGEPERLPLPPTNTIHPDVWPLLLDAWTHARMDRARPRWFWPLLLGAHDRARVRWLLDQGATHALTYTDVDALRQTRWHAEAFQNGHWTHEAHDRTHRAWVVWLLRRGLTVASDPDAAWEYHWPQIWRHTFPQGVPQEPIQRAMRQVLRDNRRLGPADCEQLEPPRGMEGLLRWLARMEQARTPVLETWSLGDWIEQAVDWRERSSEPEAWTLFGRLLASWVRLGMRLEDPPHASPWWTQVHPKEMDWSSPAKAQAMTEQGILRFWTEVSRPESPWAPFGEALLARGWPRADQLPHLLEQMNAPVVPDLFWRRQAHIRQEQLHDRPPTPGRSRPRV